MNIEKYRFIAHRGIHIEGTDIVENTIPAFELAVKNGIGIELDVQITKDNQLVVVHDSNLKRITGVNEQVNRLTLEEIKRLYVLNTKNKIPTLYEVLKVIDEKVPIIIEIKNTGKVGNLEKILLNSLKKYKGEYVIESFNPLSLLWFKIHDKSVVRGQLAAKKIGSISYVLNFFLSNMVFNIFTKPDFIAYKIRDIDEKMYKKYNKKGIYLLSWTLRTKQEYYKYNKLCEGFIFDNYDEIKGFIDKENKKYEKEV